MNFNEAFTKLIGHEGGYVNNSKDPGGETNWGISKRAYPDLDIAALTQDDAKVIYRRDYWDKAGVNMLPDAVRFDVFDGAVNSGVSQSVKWLQRAVGSPDDGVIGPVTLKAAGYLPGQVIASRYNGNRLLAMTNMSNWPNAGRGWARRIAANLQEA